MSRTPRAFIILAAVAVLFVLLAVLDVLAGDGERRMVLVTVAAIHWVGALVIVGVAEDRRDG